MSERQDAVCEDCKRLLAQYRASLEAHLKTAEEVRESIATGDQIQTEHATKRLEIDLENVRAARSAYQEHRSEEH
jgi:hypothetical protein